MIHVPITENWNEECGSYLSFARPHVALVSGGSHLRFRLFVCTDTVLVADKREGLQQTRHGLSFAGSGYCECVDGVDLGPVRVGRIQDVWSCDCDVVVDAGDCYCVGVVLAG